MAPAAPWLLAVIQDLFFGVQVTAMAKQAGLTVRYVTTAEATLAQAGEGPALVLVDLNLPGLDAPALITALKAQHPTLRVAAYVSHVQTALRQAAMNAGADPVLPRSAFATKMPAVLAGLGRS